MKKILTYLFLISFNFLTPSHSEEISDIKIEGFRIGDSLLNHLSKLEIVNEIKANKNAYDYLTDKYGEVYLYSNSFKEYDLVSFFVKQNDKDYIINDIRGAIVYDNKIEKCYKKQKKISEELFLKFKNAKIAKNDLKFPWDSNGKSHSLNITFTLNTGDVITVSCSEYEKSIKIKNGYEDGYSLSITKREVQDWLTNY